MTLLAVEATNPLDTQRRGVVYWHLWSHRDDSDENGLRYARDGV